jgi:DNA-binding XRE family transcriptional regulator
MVDSAPQPDPFPAALALQLQQSLAALPLPPALQAYAPSSTADPAAHGTTLHMWIERLLREPGVMDALQRVLQTAHQGSLGPPDTNASAPAPSPSRVVPSPASLAALAALPAEATLLDLCATVLTPMLATVLEAYIAACRGDAAPTPQPAPTLPQPFADYLHVLSAAHYQAVREALAQGTFAAVDGLPWPTARLDKGHARGHAQLRPVVTDVQPYLPPEEIERWTQLMWRQRGELADLDADTLDALSAIWLYQAKDPHAAAVADVDDLLRLRGLTSHRGGAGRRGGYRDHQRTAMLQSLVHIQNLWLTMAALETYDSDAARPGTRRRKPTTRVIQSRAFVITDLLGQLRLDGFVDVEKFLFRPGEVFAHFLSGPGRQTALLSAKALAYDPYRQTWEKRLTRYLSWQWRCAAHAGDYVQPFAVTTLLTAVGHPVNPRRLTWQRTRLEKALDTIQHDVVIATWQYAQEHADWPKSTVLIEPPDVIREQYQHLEQLEAPRRRPVLAPDALGARLKRRRQALGLSQIQAAEQLGLHQGHFSRLERGQVTPSLAVRKRLETWCAGEA